ncbi:hypothetical protein GCK72_021734 [Caenorhabditis remanei]|uniref:F-box domain-containing protein n=1 Tax=Caenorhabditis remanei TaxID=31234 RepID=A0A6A5GKV9_CAERE|nr:hypothetical protein GCK72_021734 [Caenorhabditis remanei]KAF1755165.1 hypothetical protein GCK72_021734 [Caenorhabditis remanei]
MPSLPDLPGLVMNHILDYCDVRSIFSLRKVSPDLRNHIDDVIPSLHLSGIKIEVREGFLFLVLSDDIEIKYGSFSRMCYENDDDEAEPVERKGCKVECNNMKHFLEGENFMDVFRNDLELLLKFQKADPETLERVVLQWCDDEDWCAIRTIHQEEIIKSLEEIEKNERNAMMNPLKTIFEEIAAKQGVSLKARTFETRGVFIEEAKSLLKLFQPGTLKCIKIHDPHLSPVKRTFTRNYIATIRNPIYIVTLNGIEDLNQWKQADELDTNGFHITARDLVESFGHFSRGKVELSGATGEEIFNLMQAFLKSPNFKNFELTIPQSIIHMMEEYSRVTELSNVLGPARVTRRGEQDGRRVFEWTLRNPDFDSAVILVYSPPTNFQFYRL